jgi:5-methyltetrahydropteroyltriglutamate--homocysteine methyltransferase
MSEPRILTTVVGSYPIPQWLGAYPSSPNLRDAILVVLKTQELAGIDVIADGELSRFNPSHPETNGMIDYFIAPMSGIETDLSREELEHFRATSGMTFRTQPAGVVRGPIGEGLLDLPAAWRSVQSLTSAPLKFTVTAPYMLAKTLVDEHYADLHALTMDIADVLKKQIESIDADTIQIDEANLPGHPEDAAWAHEPINRVLEGVQNRKAMHFCFGNYGGQSIQKGYWSNLMDFFNKLSVDHLVLEFARRVFHDGNTDELSAFQDLRDDIALGLGVIDIKDNVVESPEEVARRIEVGVNVLGESRMRWIHPDCGFWMLPRSVADRKMAALVAGRDLYEGR